LPLAVFAVTVLLVNDAPCATIARGDVAYAQSDIYPGRKLVWSWVDDKIGDLAILPAEALFSARYRLPIASYRAALVPRYVRDYRTLDVVKNRLEMGAPWTRRVSHGLVPVREGLRIATTEARFVFQANWPFATHLVFTFESPREASLRVHVRGFIYTSRGHPLHLEASREPRAYSVALDEGDFDSGIVELVFSADPDALGATLVSIEIEDRTPRVPSLGR
jgi:hypothetical protein